MPSPVPPPVRNGSEIFGIPVLELNEVPDLGIYIDGADEANPRRELIKGGGAALTREKIIAAAAHTFVCIVDDSKLVEVLGRFPLPVEVIPMARELLIRRLAMLGGRPVWREGITTDNGNQIIDVHEPADQRTAGTGSANQPAPWRGDGRIVRTAPGRRADHRHR